MHFRQMVCLGSGVLHPVAWARARCGAPIKLRGRGSSPDHSECNVRHSSKWEHRTGV